MEFIQRWKINSQTPTKCLHLVCYLILMTVLWVPFHVFIFFLISLNNDNQEQQSAVVNGMNSRVRFCLQIMDP